MSRPVDPLPHRNRTLAVDLDLLVRIAGGGGRVELSLEDDGRFLALIMPAAGLAYSAHGETPREAVQRLRALLDALVEARP